MSVVIKLQNLPITASSHDIRQFFCQLNIPEGGVHIGPEGDAFITFSTDEDARLAMKLSGSCLKDSVIYLSLSSRNEMAEVIEAAHQKAISMLNSVSRSSAVPLPPHNFINRALWLSLANPQYSLTNENSDMNGVNNNRNMTHFIQNNIVNEPISKPRTQQQQQPVNDSISSNKNHENNNNNWSSSLDFLLEMTTDPKKCVLITGIPSMNISEKNVVDFFSDTGLIPFDIFIFQDGKILCKFADSKKAFRAVMMKNGSKFQDHHCEIVSVMVYQPAIHSYLLKRLNNKNEQVAESDTKSPQYQPQQQKLQEQEQQQINNNNYKSESFEFKAKTLSNSNSHNRSVSPNFRCRKQRRMYRLPFNKSNQQLKSSHGVPLLLQNRPPLLGLAPRPLLLNPQQQNPSHGHQSVVSLPNFLVGNNNNNNHSNNNILLGTSSSASSFSVPNTLHSNLNNNINGTSIINPVPNCRNPFALAIQQLQSVVNIPNSSTSSISSSSFSDKDDRSNSNNNNNNTNNAPQATAEQVARFSKPGCVLAMENFPIQARMDDILNFLKETLELDITRNRIIRRFDEVSHPTGDIRLAFDTPFEAQLAQKRLNGTYMYNNFIRCSILTNF